MRYSRIPLAGLFLCCVLPAQTAAPRAEGVALQEVTFSFGELDPGLGAAHVIVADKRRGKPLFGYQGPLRLKVATDEAPVRGVRLLA